MCAAGRWCSSYQTEMVAMNLALQWLIDNPNWCRARIVTDSKSSLESMRNLQYNTKNNLLHDTYEKMALINKDITITWVASHCGVVGNEKADEAADKAAKMDQQDKGWLFDVAKARCRAAEQKRTLEHARCVELYTGGRIKEEEEARMSREDLTSLRRFRTGHTMELLAYQRRVGASEEGNCRACGEGEETTEHIMVCPRLAQERAHSGVSRMRDLVALPGRPNEFGKGAKKKLHNH